MSIRHKRMLGILLGAVMVSLWWGCSQPDDILSEIGSSTFYLNPERLPSLPSDMSYELWVTDNDADTISLGKFKWDNLTKHFTDLDGNLRTDSGQFNLSTDALKYKSILLSVEVHPDVDPTHAGPVMLVDSLNDPDDNPITLRFPLSDSLWNAVSYFNMETPTDSNIYDNEGYGVWFSAFQVQVDTVTDTLSLDSFEIDTVLTTQPADPSKKGQDTFFVENIINIGVDTITRILGFDTIQQIIPVYDRVIGHDGVISPPAKPTRITTELTLYFTVGGSIVIEYGQYFRLAGGYGFIDYSEQGWMYRGWVVSTVAADAGCGTGPMTLPAWGDDDPINRYIPGHSTGSLLSIGRFSIDSVKDIDNPYSIGPRRPDIPGEDFLQNLPNGIPLPAEGLVPSVMNPAGTFGSVIITLEPSNFTKQGVTNFPLIFMTRELPSLRDSITADTLPDIVEEFVLYNKSGAVHGDLVGFPRVNVTLVRK
ncbi:MAG: anti-sigma factor [Candidatus Zixiibacteriota bacterium]